jgi:prepilin-type N-terminal cleavage/methylation domain-containing protein
MRTTEGFSVLEVVVAIAISAILLAALATANVATLQQTRSGNLQIQATQMLDSIGRRVVAGNDNALLPAAGATIAFDYGELTGLFAFDGAGIAPERYRASVSRDAPGTVTVGASTLAIYEIEVCFEAADGERCVTGTTVSRRNP